MSKGKRPPGEVHWTPLGPGDVSGASYVPIRDRTAGPSVGVEYDGVIVRTMEGHDRPRVASWLSQPEVHGPLGFARSIPEAAIARGVVPDLTGGMESVEYLAVERKASAEPIGFIVCYECRRPGDPEQEVDFALPDPADGTVGTVRAIRTAMLAYLFAVRGASAVRWVRRRRTDEAPERLAGDPARAGWRQGGAEHRVSRAEFAEKLARLSEDGTDQLPRLRRGSMEGPAEERGARGDRR